MKVSIVINTYNRAASLGEILGSLRRQNYDDFEVIVVNGPSTDNTEAVLRAFRHQLRIGRCADRNLSISRNVGIEMSRGDVVAFIDDDAIPDEDWLTDITAAYDADEVGGVGGFVYDHTGYDLYYRFARCDRMGVAQINLTRLPTYHAYPGTPKFPHLVGTNATYRRSALVGIGGFDEEYDYWLDETDVCLRLTDAGFLLKQVPRAFVYHRFKPSYTRDTTGSTINWYPIIKNKTYFLLRHSGLSVRAVLAEMQKQVDAAEQQVKSLLSLGIAKQDSLDRFYADADRALRDGVVRGFSRSPRLMGTVTANELRGTVSMDALGDPTSGAFKKFPTILPKSRKLTVCLLSQQYPPGVVSGIGRLTYELACGLAEYGHNVHVLTPSTRSEHNTVDYEQGVWVHRLIADGSQEEPPPGVSHPTDLWRHSRRMLREIYRIHASHPVDIVETPVWNAEGLAVVVDGSFRTVTSLETPMKMVLQTNPGYDDGSPAMRTFLDQLIAAETMVVERATAVRAISAAIRETFHKLYHIRFKPGQVFVAPIGIEDRAALQSGHKTESFIDIMFTGRFEGRKGIDLLFEIIPDICRAHRDVRFVLVGEDSQPLNSGMTMTEEFRARYRGDPFLQRVIFAGKVPDEERDRLLNQCDIFVAPSRYESFGIIFLEAMMFGKPVVGARVGGMEEVVMDGITGLLAEPGDAESLRQALAALICDRALRESFGRAGRARFVSHFTRQKFGALSVAFYRQVIENPLSWGAGV
jgi:glycogen(starch) synthase